CPAAIRARSVLPGWRRSCSRGNARLMRALWVILVGALAILPDLGAAQHFAPHRAVYEMSLHGSGRDSPIMSVDGEMAVDWTETCEGWALEHRSSFDIGVGGEQSARLST